MRGPMKRRSLSLLEISRDERGSVAILFGLMAVPLFLMIGLAIDYTRAVKVRSAMQSVADGATLAGATLPSDATIQERSATAQTYFAANLKSRHLPSVIPQVTADDTSVSLTASGTIPTLVLRIAHVNSFPLKVTSVAERGDAVGGPVCLLALDPSSDNGVHIQGANIVNYPNCWAHTNSTTATAINSNGSKATATGQGHCAVGSYSDSAHDFAPTPTPGCQPIDDPFATVSAYPTASSYVPSFTPPTIPQTCQATNLNLKKGSYTLSPGRYCGGLSLQAQAKVTLSPGIYIIDNGELNVQSGANVTGSNVLFYFTGANAHMTLIGGGTVTLKGRDQSSSYASFLFIADATAWQGNASNIQGGGSLTLEGVLYMPTQTILVSGNGDVNGTSTSTYFAMIAKDFNFKGNGTFNLIPASSSTLLKDIMPTTHISKGAWLKQ